MKRIITIALALALLGFGQTARAQDFVTILTGGTSGVYYPLGVALSNIYGEALPDARVTVQSTKASVENLNLLQAGRGEIAFALGDSVSQAWKGVEEAGFRQKLERLRGITNVYANFIQIVANAEAGIASVADLAGKRVAVGAPRSGTELNARAVLGAAGLSYDDLGKVEYLPFAESVDLMKNRQLDATLISAGLGVAAVRDLSQAIEIALVPVPPELVAAIGDPAYQSSTIPGGTYRGQDEDVPAAAVRNVLVTHEGVTEETAYTMTKALFENLDGLRAAHAAARGIALDAAAANTPVPLHPGAARYFEEQGIR